MSKRTKWIVIVVVVVAFLAVIYFCGDSLYEMLLAMHGKRAH